MTSSTMIAAKQTALPSPGAVKVAAAAYPGKGRGLCALAPLEAGELLDRAPSVLLSSADCDLLEKTSLGDFYFAHPENGDDGLLLLGRASLCNFAEDPNADVRWQREEGIGWIAELVALRPIAAGEEITYRYRCGPWFEVAS